MKTDRLILRGLGERYAEIAQSGGNIKKMDLYRKINGLKPERPVVMIDEVPWNEFRDHEELKLQCGDEVNRGYEWFLRRWIFSHKHFPADNVLVPYIPVRKKIQDTGIGIRVKEDTVDINQGSDAAGGIISHAYIDQLQNKKSVDALLFPAITYLKGETEEELERVCEIFDGIIEARAEGFSGIAWNPWDDISRYRGVEPLLTGLADEPELMHYTMEKLLAIIERRLDQYEELDLLHNPAYYIHCTAGLCDELQADGPVTLKIVWGRGTAQLFGSVSREMHNEFDTQYMIKLMKRFGLVYYGCCEPLDNKIDIISKIPNLRKISISPWAKIEPAAEAIGSKYVFAAKPNPAFVADSSLDAAAVRQEINAVLSACRKNGTTCEFVLKDISTCKGKLSNLAEWEKIAMECVLQ